MFCNQCEQTAHGTGCVLTPGVCGKNDDVQSLQETLLYGLKGMASYAHHARRLGKTDENVSAFMEEALFATVTNVNFDIDSLFELVLECGKQNLRVMELLDQGHVEKYGAPAPVEVCEGTKAGPGILITGHDMVDLDNLLRQCEGTDVKVYTHGEMLPAHMYPKLRAHPNLAGHFGGAWQKQKKEFEQFTGPVLATTNCILEPRESYADRVFTTRVTAVSLRAPLDAVEAAGWKLVYDTTANKVVGAWERSDRIVLFPLFSLGLRLKEDGYVTDVAPGTPAARAGVAPGMRLVAVDGRKYSATALRDALKASAAARRPLDLLVENDDFFRTHRVATRGGERQPHLRRDPARPDLLGDILKARTR